MMNASETVIRGAVSFVSAQVIIGAPSSEITQPLFVIVFRNGLSDA